MSSGRKIFWGVFLVLGAVCMALDSIGKMPYISNFKLIAVIVLIAMIVKNIVRFSFTGVLIPLAFLFILFQKQIGITHVSAWIILIVAVALSAGLELLFGKKK